MANREGWRMKVRRRVIYSVFDLGLNTFDMGKLMKEFGKISKRKKNTQ